VCQKAAKRSAKLGQGSYNGLVGRNLEGVDVVEAVEGVGREHGHLRALDAVNHLERTSAKSHYLVAPLNGKAQEAQQVTPRARKRLESE
jgi:hypothetical protein